MIRPQRPGPNSIALFVVCLLALFGATQCATLVGADTARGLQRAACPQLGMGTRALTAEYTARAEVNAQIGAFVAASAGLSQAARDAEVAAAAACRAMGRDLGIPARRMRAESDGPGAEVHAACTAVGAEIRAILDEGVAVRVNATAPKCRASADARARCEGSCDVELTPAQIVARCEPGKLSGQCQGTCRGRCEGTCEGACQGRCAAEGPGGQCDGRCRGTCMGECNGVCHASCSGEWKAPRCEADIQAPRVAGSCDASCEAYAKLEATCSPGRVDVQTSANTERVVALVATLRQNLPPLIRAQVAIGKRLIGNARTLVEVGADLPDVMAEAGGRAMTCVGAAADAAATATATFNVTVQASAQVTGAVGADVGTR